MSKSGSMERRAVAAAEMKSAERLASNHGLTLTSLNDSREYQLKGQDERGYEWVISFYPGNGRVFPRHNVGAPPPDVPEHCPSLMRFVMAVALRVDPTLEFPKVTIGRSDADDVPIVFIDTDPKGPENKRGPHVRIYLNDECVFENPPLKGGEGTAPGGRA